MPLLLDYHFVCLTSVLLPCDESSEGLCGFGIWFWEGTDSLVLDDFWAFLAWLLASGRFKLVSTGLWFKA